MTDTERLDFLELRATRGCRQSLQGFKDGSWQFVGGDGRMFDGATLRDVLDAAIDAAMERRNG